MIQVGQAIPDTISLIKVENGAISPYTSAELKSGRIVIFGVPGAFTPTCSNHHLPSYVEKESEIKAKGIDKIYCISVNDPFVMKAWGEASHVNDKVTLLADGNAEFTKAVGLEMDASAFGLGIRSLRYAMVLNDGVVEKLLVEEDAAECGISRADRILDHF